MVVECEPPAGVNSFSAVIPQRPSTRGNRIVPGITYQKIFEYMRADPRLVSGEIPSIALVDRQDTANASTRAFFEAISLVAAAPPATRPIGLWMNAVGMRCPTGPGGRRSRYDLFHVVHSQEIFAVDVDDTSYVCQLN